MMAGVLRLFTVGLGASAQKKKSSPGDEPRGAKECEAACACRSPVTQKSRSQARLFLPAKPFCENLAPLLPKAILVKVTKKSSFGLHSHNAFLSEIAPSETVVYLDETFQQPTPQFPNSFYSVCGVVLQGQHIFTMQDDLREIVGGNYWHATEALRDGRTHVFLDMLEHMRAHPTMNIIVATTNVDGSDEQAMENARHQVLSELLIDLTNADKSFRGAIMEQRDNRRKNNSDDAFIRNLRLEEKISPAMAFKLISPQIDRNLWLPDTAAMAYRRTITHPYNETSQWFGDYLQKFSHVTVLNENTNLDPRVLPIMSERMKKIQNDPQAPERYNQAPEAKGPLGFLMQQQAKMPLAQLIEQQLNRATPDNTQSESSSDNELGNTDHQSPTL